MLPWLIENRIQRLLPWVERRRERALDRGDQVAAFRASMLNERLYFIDTEKYPPDWAFERAIARTCGPSARRPVALLSRRKT
jgi:hypothetical protein